MPKCSIVGCRSGYTGNYGIYQYFFLPKSQEMHRQWLEKINRANFIPTKHTVVCERHFRSSDFVPAHENLDCKKKPKKRKALKPFAIPSLFLGYGPIGDNHGYCIHYRYGQGIWHNQDSLIFDLLSIMNLL